MNTPTPNPDSNTNNSPAPFAPVRLFLGIATLILTMQAFVLVQGYFMTLAGLTRQQIIVMIRPIYIYALPATYLISKWLGRTLPKKAIFLAIMLALNSVLLVSFMNHLWYELPFAHSITDIYILTTYLAMSVLGGLQGRKTGLA